MTNSIIDKYVNKIGQLWLNDNHEMSFPGQIVYVDSDYYLVGSMIKHDLIKEINQQRNKLLDLTFYGLIDGMHVSFFCCYLKQSSPYVRADAEDFKPDFSATISFGDVLIGTMFVNCETKVSAAIVRFSNLEEFIREKVCEFDFQKGMIFKQSRQLKYNTKEYSLEFVLGLSHTSTLKKGEFNFPVSSRFVFSKKISIVRARTHIAHFRMLMSMLKLHYIDIYDIELYINWDDNSGKNSCRENSFYYYLNHMPQSTAELWPVPRFCLNHSDISGDLERILNNWLIFQSVAEPIVEMFYQILINKSYDINLLLNLVQAMEVFSNRFRKKEVKQVLERYPRQKPDSTAPTTWHKVFDLLNCANLCFNFEEVNLEKIASWIVDTRNYYTHYGRKTKDTLTLYEERGPVNRLMRYLLTILIYNKLGVKMELIAEKFYHPFYKSTLQQIKNMLLSTVE